MSFSFRALLAKSVYVLLLTALAACSVPDEPTDIHDPYESVNRSVHAFNKGLDTVIVRPTSQVYGNLLPSSIRTGVDNVSANFRAPSMAVNDVLQGRGEDAIHNTFRFLVNSTAGVLGFFDVALTLGLEERFTDFGETLAVWGAPEGAYLELPFFGPSTERAAIGTAIDIFTNPVGYLNVDRDVNRGRVIAYAGNVVNTRYVLTSSIDSILYDSEDSYAQLRLFYLQSSRFSQAGTDAPVIDTEIYDDLYGDIFDE